MALGAGAVSFGQIVKAGEPVFAAATNAVVLKDIDAWQVGACWICCVCLSEGLAVQSCEGLKIVHFFLL